MNANLVTQTVTSKDGTVITFDKLGHGPVVILVSGAMIHRKFPPFTKLAELLAERFTVINYDRRGRFDSGDTLPYSPEKEVEDIAALLNAVGGKASIYGISSGGALAIRAAASGLGFDKIAIYEAPYIGWNETKLGKRSDYLARLDQLIRQGDRAAVVKSFLALVGVPGFVRLLMPLFSFWKSALSIAHTIPYDLRILGDQNIPAALVQKIKAPALVMAGGLSSADLRDSAKKLAEQWPSAQYQEIPKQRHDISPEVQAEVLKKFFL